MALISSSLKATMIVLASNSSSTSISAGPPSTHFLNLAAVGPALKLGYIPSKLRIYVGTFCLLWGGFPPVATGCFLWAGVTSLGQVLLVVGSFGFLRTGVVSREQVLLPKGRFLTSPCMGR